MTFIDTGTFIPGKYHVGFDVSDFQSTNRNTPLFFHVYEGSDTRRGHVKLQLTSQRVMPELAASQPLISSALGAKIREVSVDHRIEEGGRFGLEFEIAEAGEAGDFVALVWSQVKLKGTGAMPSMTVDNLVVSKLAPD